MICDEKKWRAQICLIQSSLRKNCSELHLEFFGNLAALQNQPAEKKYFHWSPH